MPEKTVWQKTMTGSKAGFDKLWKAADKLGGPVNRLSNKLGSEAFWPTTLDKESEKAARILRSFCKDGFYSEEETYVEGQPKGKQRVIKKIPTSVIQKAKGLAIFTTMRSGLWISGAGGSGVVVARKADGEWSEPAGILLHTAGLGFLIGVDIYDCVLVLNTQKAVDAFQRLRWTLGGELSAVAGPVGMGGIVDTELHTRQSPIFTYMKSRGFYAGVQVDGTVIIERNDENERFYHEKLSTAEILAGKVRHPPWELEMLAETLKAAQGDSFDNNKLPEGPPPADNEVEESGHIFGVPDKEDPDPFGVHALEQEGFKVKDAATHEPVPEETFEFNPSAKSPIYTAYNKIDTKRVSRSSINSGDAPARPSMDAATQTEGSTLESGSNGTITPRKGPPPPLPPRQSLVKPIQREDLEAEDPEKDIKPEVDVHSETTLPEVIEEGPQTHIEEETRGGIYDEADEKVEQLKPIPDANEPDSSGFESLKLEKVVDDSEPKANGVHETDDASHDVMPGAFH